MSGKVLLPRHADESKLRKKKLSCNVKYVFDIAIQGRAVGTTTY